MRLLGFGCLLLYAFTADGARRSKSSVFRVDPASVDLAASGETPLQSLFAAPSHDLGTNSLLRIDRAMNTSNDYDCFQLYHPLPDYGEPVYMQVLVEHTFGNSYNKPCETMYIPPPEIDFNRVVLSLQIKTNGHQFDRLGSILLGGVELWRTSTAEPGGKEILFGHSKDVSKYLSLFQESHKLSVLLNNVVNDRYTGEFDMVLTATYYFQTDKPRVQSSQSVHQSFKQTASGESTPPNAITPLLKGDSSIWVHPADDMIIQLDPISRNTTRLGVEIMATGDSHEEFWYSILSNQTTNYLNLKTKSGHPTRVVNVFVNDELAGQAIPQPVIFTGGISPYMWSPIVGMDTFDIPHVYVDLTPYLPVFWTQNTIIKLVITNGIDTLKVQNSNWLVSAALTAWELPGVVGDGHIEDSIVDSISYSNVAPHFARRNEHTSHNDGDAIHQGVGFSRQLSKQSHMVYYNSENGLTEAFKVEWKQSLMAHNFLRVNDLGTPSQLAHLQSQADLLEVRNLQTMEKVRPIDCARETPLHITLSQHNYDHVSEVVQKSLYQTPSEIVTHYLASNSTITRKKLQRIGRGSTQQAVIHKQTENNKVYMRHVAASEGAVIFDGRWRGDGGTTKQHIEPPGRLYKFMKRVDPLRDYVIKSAKSVRRVIT